MERKHDPQNFQIYVASVWPIRPTLNYLPIQEVLVDEAAYR